MARLQSARPRVSDTTSSIEASCCERSKSSGESQSHNKRCSSAGIESRACSSCASILSDGSTTANELIAANRTLIATNKELSSKLGSLSNKNLSILAENRNLANENCRLQKENLNLQHANKYQLMACKNEVNKLLVTCIERCATSVSDVSTEALTHTRPLKYTNSMPRISRGCSMETIRESDQDDKESNETEQSQSPQGSQPNQKIESESTGRPESSVDLSQSHVDYEYNVRKDQACEECKALSRSRPKKYRKVAKLSGARQVGAEPARSPSRKDVSISSAIQRTPLSSVNSNTLESPSQRDGKLAKRRRTPNVNYALPSLKTKMRKA